MYYGVCNLGISLLLRTDIAVTISVYCMSQKGLLPDLSNDLQERYT
jgi:hypothetical protein